jgi:RNA recognition motif-containing protein
MTTLYVGNLAFSTTDDDLFNLFRDYGAVSSARVALDRETRRPRGFGFVEFQDADGAARAIAALNGAQHQGRALVVNEARPREERPRFARARS